MLSTDHIVLPNKLMLAKHDGFQRPLNFTKPLDLQECWGLSRPMALPIFDLDGVDQFCTVLYNDEQHTFDQVISTIMKVLKCDKKTASEYVTNIDREGRSVIKCGSFPACVELGKEIEKCMGQHGTKPLKVCKFYSNCLKNSNSNFNFLLIWNLHIFLILKVLIVSTDVIIHQTFAIRLLDWINVFLNYGQIFRSVFVKVLLDEDTKYLDLILLNDSDMWKSARLHFHRLIISG